ncbi:WAS/WASL-interacting protein family member 2 isoform X1 [Protopterus annectens]|uniref:WAS/WASL-interacting protein family member 2 isoform X1 n=1 Tax=Protopterus annectens TaxID=7888 RepID=UPI001CF9954E|nr:WAS/WASL-interacting protein family member 2 isoform X1 [Protopterus annectens]
MPIPPPPPPPPLGPPPPPTFNQANTEPPKLSREEHRGRGALLQDICKGAKLKKVTNVSDRSAPVLEKPKGGGGGGGSGGFGSSSGSVPPMGGLFQGGVPKLRPVGGGESQGSRSALQVPTSRSSAPKPPLSTSNSRLNDDPDSGRPSPPDVPRTHRPSLPDLTRPNSGSSSTGMKHSSSAPPPPPGRRTNAPPAPPSSSNKTPSYNREKPLPPTPGLRGPSNREGPPAPPPVKPPPSPVNARLGSHAQNQSLPPPPPYRQPPVVSNGPSSPNNECAPELPQRHNSLHRKTSGAVRSIAPPPPPPSPSPSPSGRPPPPARDPPSRGAAPPPPPPLMRNGNRDAPPPPPPYRGSSEPPSRGKPPPPPSRTPAGPPPPPPPVRNGYRDSIIPKTFLDDFESKYSFHPVEDFPAPEDYRPCQKVYPSKSRATRGAPPLPPLAR